MQKKNKGQKYIRIYLMTGIFVLVCIFFVLMVFHYYIDNLREDLDEKEYSQYYTMIVEDRKSSFWQSIYQGAYERGQEENVYVEMLGENLSVYYSKEELMKIAIASDVDGILVEADESQEMVDLINQAIESEIPVITLYTDCTQSKRLSFVGVGSYNLGREYGRQVLEIINPFEKTNVTVLVNANAQDTGQNILSSGIQDTIKNEKNQNADISISYVTVDDTNMFSAEESIRDIFMAEELPDIIICLNELNTVCGYQAVVDYNKVGQVDIVGYYDSDKIIGAIDRKVMYSTITLDTEQLGHYGIDALMEYNELGTINQYFTVDVSIINRSNVYLYMEETSDETQEY